MSLRILFLEDHNDTRQVVTRLLRHYGYDVCSASTCGAADDLLDRAKFHVLLSDIGLPDGDGCEFFSKAKRKQPLIGVAVTAFCSPFDRNRAGAAGFQYYLTKPMDVAKLRSILSGIPRSTI